MELFGTRPDPSRAASADNLPTPFHVYSMRQAIEEKFILDVLQNYASYKLAFKLAHEGKDYDARFGNRMVGTGSAAEALGKRYEAAAARLGVTFPGRTLNTSLFKPRGAEPDTQASLF